MPDTTDRSDDPPRCGWVGTDPVYLRYHDEEWGVPVRDDRRMFEFLILEGFQAGLSWLTILKKREAFRRAFAGFDPERVAAFGDPEVSALLHDASIVRNRQKIEAAIGNARATLELAETGTGLAEHLWSFVGGEPIVNAWESDAQVPVTTPEAEALSKDLRRRGFRFVGPTIVYAHMQATGMVMDHLTGCFRYPTLAGSRVGRAPP